jgi:hypothetical protein
VQIIQECEVNTGFQEVKVPSSTDPSAYYLVTLPPWDRTEEEAVCECESYQFRGRCRHQREALALVCNWTELDGQPQTSQQRAERVCPECGGPTQIVVVGK